MVSYEVYMGILVVHSWASTYVASNCEGRVERTHGCHIRFQAKPPAPLHSSRLPRGLRA